MATLWLLGLIIHRLAKLGYPYVPPVHTPVKRVGWSHSRTRELDTHLLCFLKDIKSSSFGRRALAVKPILSTDPLLRLTIRPIHASFGFHIIPAGCLMELTTHLSYLIFPIFSLLSGADSATHLTLA